jgi:hypothetical protein
MSHVKSLWLHWSLTIAFLATGGTAASTLLIGSDISRMFGPISPALPSQTRTTYVHSRDFPTIGEAAPIPTIVLEPMTIRGKARASVTISLRPNECTPGWRALLSGPIGRRVFETCDSDTANKTELLSPFGIYSKERLAAPKSHHDRLPGFQGRQQRSSLRPLVIGNLDEPNSE